MTMQKKTARSGAAGTAHAHFNTTKIIQVIEISKLKDANKLTLAAGHNKRSDGRDPMHIDASRTHLNVNLRGKDSAIEIKKQSDEWMAGVLKQPRKDYVRWLEIVVSLPHGTDIDEAAFFRDVLDWFDGYFEVPVLSADVHNDERSPHLHILALPLFQGRMIGASFTRMSRYWPMHNDFSEKVGCKYGLSLPEPKTHHSAAAKARAVDDVIAAMKSVIRNLEPAFWDAVRATLKASPEPMMRFYEIDYQKKPERKAIAFADTKCIAFDSDPGEKGQRLSRVVFANNPPIIQPENPPEPDDQLDDYQRIRDDEVPAECWDDGSYHQPVTKPRMAGAALDVTRKQIAALQGRSA